MIDRLSRKPVKVNIKMLKEVGYILLLITFFYFSKDSKNIIKKKHKSLEFPKFN